VGLLRDPSGRPFASPLARVRFSKHRHGMDRNDHSYFLLYVRSISCGKSERTTDRINRGSSSDGFAERREVFAAPRTYLGCDVCDLPSSHELALINYAIIGI
jgi:hypothetical protein